MHCFTEDWDTARAALDLGFYISLSGIVTFKNAAVVKEVAQKVPLERLLVETDSPYLAPVPFRGKTNEPAFVKHVAAHIAELRGLSFETVATATTDNFFRLFAKAQRIAGQG
ncbi:putative deoxyribonuclease YcfH [compost metagenome]